MNTELFETRLEELRKLKHEVSQKVDVLRNIMDDLEAKGDITSINYLSVIIDLEKYYHRALISIYDDIACTINESK